MRSERRAGRSDGERCDRCRASGIGNGVGEHDKALCDRAALVPALQLHRRVDADRLVRRGPFCRSAAPIVIADGDRQEDRCWPAWSLRPTGSKGRRDYAVLLILLRLGLRAGEVAHLRLDDIDWRAGEVVVHGKGGHEHRLPLPSDVGEAIAAYLRRGRRNSTVHREVFLRTVAPVGPLGTNGISGIVRCACVRAGVPILRAHRLRHTLAYQMANAGVPLPEIAEVLRHRANLLMKCWRTDGVRWSRIERPPLSRARGRRARRATNRDPALGSRLVRHRSLTGCPRGIRARAPFLLRCTTCSPPSSDHRPSNPRSLCPTATGLRPWRDLVASDDCRSYHELAPGPTRLTAIAYACTSPVDDGVLASYANL